MSHNSAKMKCLIIRCDRFHRVSESELVVRHRSVGSAVHNFLLFRCVLNVWEALYQSQIFVSLKNMLMRLRYQYCYDCKYETMTSGQLSFRSGNSPSWEDIMWFYSDVLWCFMARCADFLKSCCHRNFWTIPLKLQRSQDWKHKLLVRGNNVADLSLSPDNSFLEEKDSKQKWYVWQYKVVTVAAPPVLRWLQTVFNNEQ